MRLSHGSIPLGVAVVLVATAHPGGAEPNYVAHMTVAGIQASALVSAERVRVQIGSREHVIDVATGNVLVIDHERRVFAQRHMAEFGRLFVAAETADSPHAVPVMGRALRVAVDRAGSARIGTHAVDEYVAVAGSGARVHVWLAANLRETGEMFRARQLTLLALGDSGKRLARVLAELRAYGGAPLRITTETTSIDLSAAMAVTELVKFDVTDQEVVPFEAPSGYVRTRF